MARAFNIIASGGFLVEPFVVKGIFGIHPSETRKERIISLSTRQYLTNIMIRVVELGTGKKAGIEGVEIAGKTGTTKKIKIAGRGESGYVSSFGGFFPAHDPKLTMFMVIDGPADEFYGGDVAAPLFKSIADHLLVRLGIFPELDKNNEIHL
jgi:cell division protein FtsI (penicillin-binding protein 3)